MKKILISACLLGENVKYSGGNNQIQHSFLEALQGQDVLVPCCPEREGGLTTPRSPAEIEEGFSGADVLARRARIFTNQGEDVTDAFLKGTYAVVHVDKEICMAILKAGSPSCGNKQIYDGTHGGIKKEGEGVCAALLRAQGIAVFNEYELEQAQIFWENL